MKATQKELKSAVKELNEVLGLSPAINAKGTPEEMVKGIKAAIKLIEDDEFSDETQAVIDELKPAGKTAPAPKGKKAPVVVEEDEDEEDEVEEDEDEEDEDEEEEDKEEEEEEEEEKPKAKGKKPVPAPVVAPKGKKAPVVVEEDDEEEDDEEEETPKGKKGKEKEKEVPVKKNPFKRPEGQRTKKAVVEEMLKIKGGVTIEEIAKKITDEGIDPDYKKNIVVVKLWLSKMGFATNKAAIEANPKFKAKK